MTHFFSYLFEIFTYNNSLTHYFLVFNCISPNTSSSFKIVHFPPTLWDTPHRRGQETVSQMLISLIIMLFEITSVFVLHWYKSPLSSDLGKAVEYVKLMW